MTELRLRAEGLFWRSSGDEVVALDGDASRYFSANPTAAALWKRLGDGATSEELVELLCSSYKVSRPVAEADVAAFLEQLASRGLLEQ